MVNSSLKTFDICAQIREIVSDTINYSKENEKFNEQHIQHTKSAQKSQEIQITRQVLHEKTREKEITY